MVGIVGVLLIAGVELIFGGGICAGGISCGLCCVVLCCVVRLLCIWILLISSFCSDYGFG